MSKMNVEQELLSGHYKGHTRYTDSKESEQKMMITLLFEEYGTIHGTRRDEVGSFYFDGDWDNRSRSLNMVKTYGSHDSEFIGILDVTHSEIVISGTWYIKDDDFNQSGGFVLKKDTTDQMMIYKDIESLETYMIKWFKSELTGKKED